MSWVGSNTARNRASARIGALQLGANKIQDAFQTSINEYIAEEFKYNHSLEQLSRMYALLKCGKQNEGNIPYRVYTCVTSSVELMKEISTEMEILIKMFEDVSKDEFSHWKPTEEFIKRSIELASLADVYNIFCNNEYGLFHKSLMQLFLTEKPKRDRKVTNASTPPPTRDPAKIAIEYQYQQLVEFVFSAIKRYTDFWYILDTLSEKDDSLHQVYKHFFGINSQVQLNEDKLISLFDCINVINEIVDIPSSVQLLSCGSKLIKKGQLVKQKIVLSKTSPVKNRIFYLFTDKLVYSDVNHVYKGVMNCHSLRITDDDTKRFRLLHQNEKSLKTYLITCETEKEKRNWLISFRDTIHSRKLPANIFQLNRSQSSLAKQPLLLPPTSAIGSKNVPTLQTTTSSSNIFQKQISPRGIQNSPRQLTACHSMTDFKKLPQSPQISQLSSIVQQQISSPKPVPRKLSNSSSGVQISTPPSSPVKQLISTDPTQLRSPKISRKGSQITDQFKAQINEQLKAQLTGKSIPQLRPPDPAQVHQLEFRVNSNDWDFGLIAMALLDPDKGVVRKNRTYHLQTYKNCFLASEAVLWLQANITHTNEDTEAIFIGQKLVEIGIIKPIHEEKTFQNKNHYYKKVKPKALNFSYYWPLESDTSPVQLSVTLLSLAAQLFEENRSIVTKFGVQGMNLLSIHPLYKEFQVKTAELQKIQLSKLKDDDEKFIFFCNIYNTLAIHSYIADHRKIPKGLSELNVKNFLAGSKYNISGLQFSLFFIENVILRKTPGVKIKKSDPRPAFALEKTNNLVNFALSIGTKSSPPVIVLTPEGFHKQLEEQGRQYCQRHIKIFNKGEGTWIIYLPKILELYTKEFPTLNDMLLFLIQNQYLTDEQRNSLFLMNQTAQPATSPTQSLYELKYTAYDWSFHYIIGENIDVLQKSLKLITQSFEFPTKTGETMIVIDNLQESLYCFSIPFQFLQIIYQKRKLEVQQLRNQNYNKNLFDLLPEKEGHLHLIKTSYKELKKTILNEENYHALSFRPSSYKMDPVLQFVPLNMHQHITTVNLLNFSYYHTTFGAPAAHYYKFKQGGLRQLIQAKQTVSLSTAESAVKIYEIDMKIEQRQDICFSQILTAFVNCFTLTLLNHCNPPLFMRQIASIGFLIHFESLLSTIGSENGMLGDMDHAVFFLNSHVKLVLVKSEDENVIKEDKGMPVLLKQVDDTNPRNPYFCSFVFEFTLPPSIFELIPESSLETPTRSEVIHIYAVLSTQGINEQQSIAIYRGETKIQEEINAEHFAILTNYYFSFRNFAVKHQCLNDAEIEKLTADYSKIKKIVHTSRKEKNVEILPFSADLVRKLNGGRMTSCKSAKDRTSMSITWEQARWLHMHAKLPKQLIFSVANHLRTNGSRKENAFKNIGKEKFAFNSLQRKLIPDVYRVPKTVGASAKS